MQVVYTFVWQLVIYKEFYVIFFIRFLHIISLRCNIGWNVLAFIRKRSCVLVNIRIYWRKITWLTSLKQMVNFPCQV